jgi:hypothetical protein
MGYSAADIVGKTLFARTQVPYRYGAYDDSQIVGYFQPGQKIGVVDTWVGIKEGRSFLNWSFIGPTGTPYYVEHRGSYFDLDSLRAQGVLTQEEQAQAAADANMGPIERAAKAITGAVTGGVLIYAIVSAFKS